MSSSSSSSRTARLRKEVVGYVVGASSSSSSSSTSTSKEAPSHAAVVSLSNPNASSPLSSLRGTTPTPSSSSFDVVTTHDGEQSLIVHADRVRPLIHVHDVRSSSSARTSPLLARLHPPEPTPTLALSPRGTLLAAGASSGRLYLWHLGSGRLLAAVDAHFRAVTCLRWSACERSLVSGSQDARILVWSVEALISGDDGGDAMDHDDHSTRLRGAPKPYAIFSDHVQAITTLTLSSSSRSSVSSFPSSLRVLSASLDGTVKLWDVRTRTLVATWSFSGPIKHLVVDVGFRAFFVVVTLRTRNESRDEEPTQTNSDWVHKVDLFSSAAHTTTTSTSAATLFDESTHNDEAKAAVYQSETGIRITALAMSMSGAHLLIGTSDVRLITIDTFSSVAIRTTSLLAAGQGVGVASSGKSGGGGQAEVTCLTTFLIDDASSLLLGASVQGKGGGGGATGTRQGRQSAFPVAEVLQRTVSTLKEGEPFAVRLEKRNVLSTIESITPPSLQKYRTHSLEQQQHQQGSNVLLDASRDDSAQREAIQRIAQLERDNEKLHELLKRAQKTNAGLWERVVKDTAGTAGQQQEAMHVDT